MTSFGAVIPVRYRNPAKEYAGFGFADVLSFARIAMVVPVIILAILGLWVGNFWTLLTAWSTDAVDGMLAKKYGSWLQKHPKIDMDGIADSVLAFFSSFVPIVVMDGWWRWTFAGLWAASVVSAIWMILVMDRSGSRGVVALNMIVFHGLYQVVLVPGWFAYMAYGWKGAVLMSVATLILAYFERDKIRSWWHGVFKPEDIPGR